MIDIDQHPPQRQFKTRKQKNVSIILDCTMFSQLWAISVIQDECGKNENEKDLESSADMDDSQVDACHNIVFIYLLVLFKSKNIVILEALLFAVLMIYHML